MGLLLNFAPHTFPDPVAIDFKATEGESNLTKCYFQPKVLIFNTEKEKNLQQLLVHGIEALTQRLLLLLLQLALAQVAAEVLRANAVIPVGFPLLRSPLLLLIVCLAKYYGIPFLCLTPKKRKCVKP